MRRGAFLACGAVLGLLLSACGSAPEPSYRLKSLVPSPVTPGATVTAYGLFPDGSRVMLDGQTLHTVAVPGGLKFTLPDHLLAGTPSLHVTGPGVDFPATLQVLPRIDHWQLDGSVLTVDGAGWWTASATAEPQLEVGGQLLSPSAARSALQVALPRAESYGPSTVRLLVNGQASEAFTLTRSAARVTGTVQRPLGPTASLVTQTMPKREPDRVDGRALLVRGVTAPISGLAGLDEVQFEPALRSARLLFHTEAAAQAGLTALHGTRPELTVTYDPLVQPAGSAALLQASPAQLNAADFTPPTEQWHLGRLGLPEAWDRTRGAGVTVAVVDTGVLLNHPDLTPNLLPGYDFVDNDASPEDLYGHGTHVAGLIAAHGRVLGSAPEARLVPVRVIGSAAGGSAFNVARGILWAANLLPDLPNPHPADLINLSLGLDGEDPLITDAVQAALRAGVVVVAAAGNSGGTLASPANIPGVISVTSVAGPVATYQPGYANRGPGLQLAAYGGDLNTDQDRNGMPDGLYSTDRTADGQSSYGLRMGTSMATPVVTGIAALALSAGTPRTALLATLTGTATDLDATGYDFRTGFGLVSPRLPTQTGPRTYVLASDATGTVIASTLVDPSGRYTLGQLPPGEAFTVWAASDEDGDGLIAEAGELYAEQPPRTLGDAGETTVEPLRLDVTGGQHAYRVGAPATPHTP